MSWQGQWEGQWQGKWDGSIEVNPNAMYGSAVGTSSASGTLTTVSQTPDEPVADTHDYVDPRYIRWWLNKHKKKPVETVEEALEIVQETVQEEAQKPRVAPQIVAARDDYQLQLFIAQQILAARQELDRYQRELEDEEEAILALLL